MRGAQGGRRWLVPVRCMRVTEERAQAGEQGERVREWMGLGIKGERMKMKTGKSDILH